MGALAEVACETDFVASNPKFTGFASQVAEVVCNTEPADVEALLAADMNGETVQAGLTEMIHISGENMKITRFTVRKPAAGAVSATSTMGGKIGVMVEFAFNNAETASADAFKTFATTWPCRLPRPPRSPLCARTFRRPHRPRGRDLQGAGR